MKVTISEYQIKEIIAKEYGVEPWEVIMTNWVYIPRDFIYGGNYDSELEATIILKEEQ